MAFAYDLIADFTPKVVIADRAYDADRFHDAILNKGARPVIPPRRHRRNPHAYDAVLYKERNRVERFFGKLKQFRRVATRYDKLLQNFMGFAMIAAILIWMK
jgi:putative transposase